MNETCWTHPEKKWTPRNKQAALITRKAKPFFMPVPDEPKPVMAETFAQKLARENAEREKRVAEIKAESARKAALMAEHNRKQREQSKARRYSGNWAEKQEKKLTRYGGYTRRGSRAGRSFKR